MDIFCIYDAYCCNFFCVPFFHLCFCSSSDNKNNLNDRFVLLPVLSRLIQLSMFDTIFLMHWLKVPLYQYHTKHGKSYLVQVDSLTSVFNNGSFSATLDHMFRIRHHPNLNQIKDEEFTAMLSLFKLSSSPPSLLHTNE